MVSNETRQGREKLTLIRVFEALRGLGYEAAYDAVRHYARIWQRNQAATSIDALVPLNPDEAYQFDWSHEFVLINGRGDGKSEACPAGPYGNLTAPGHLPDRYRLMT